MECHAIVDFFIVFFGMPRYCRFIHCEMWNATQLSTSILRKVKYQSVVGVFIAYGGMPAELLISSQCNVECPRNC